MATSRPSFLLTLIPLLFAVLCKLASCHWLDHAQWQQELSVLPMTNVLNIKFSKDMRQENKVVKQAIRDAVVLANLIAQSLNFQSQSSEESQQEYIDAFRKVFGSSHPETFQRALKERVANVVHRAIAVLEEGILVSRAEAMSDECRCKSSTGFHDAFLGICHDGSRLGAFVRKSRVDGQIVKDGSGNPILYFCSHMLQENSGFLFMTILHEAIHVAALDIGDHAYGHDACIQLASRSPALAPLNSDSYIEYGRLVLQRRAEERSLKRRRSIMAALGL